LPEVRSPQPILQRVEHREVIFVADEHATEKSHRQQSIEVRSAGIFLGALEHKGESLA
jgi:hypothetical protein